MRGNIGPVGFAISLAISLVILVVAMSKYEVGKLDGCASVQYRDSYTTIDSDSDGRIDSTTYYVYDCDGRQVVSILPPQQVTR